MSNGSGLRQRGWRHGGRRLAVLGGVLLCLGGCAGSRGGHVAYNRTDFVAPDLPRLTTSADEHLLQPGDVVSVNVFQVDSLSGDRQVDLSGQIQIPLIGAVAAQGHTVKQLAANLATKLDATYLKSPRVEVLLKAMQVRSVTVDGSVKQAGVYQIAGDVTLIQAVALARGTDTGANVKRVVVFRQIDGQRQAAAFDLSTIRAGKEVDPTIYDNDVIVVDGSATRQAFRDFLSAVPLLAVFRPF
ncbi:polysaccharide export protein [Sphingosinicellaceae bacterium]|nr:polysaccharide export protein [Sphingosinicellaceae bacterium]